MPHPLHPQNGLHRLLTIELRAPGKPWKRVRGDETMSRTLRPGVRYEIRVTAPAVVGLGIEGEPVMAPDQVLPLHD